MKKKIPVIIAFIITIAAAVFFGDTTKASKIYDSNVNTISYTDLGVLENDQFITQKFVCSQDTVNGFMIKSSVCGNYGDVVVNIEVSDAQTGEVLTVINEQGVNIKARKVHYYKADEPLTNMKGKTLEVKITETGSVQGSGINMYYAPAEESNYLIAVNGSEIGGVLPLATAADGFDVETCIIFLLSVWFIWGFMWFLYKLFQ